MDLEKRSYNSLTVKHKFYSCIALLVQTVFSEQVVVLFIWMNLSRKETLKQYRRKIGQTFYDSVLKKQHELEVRLVSFTKNDNRHYIVSYANSKFSEVQKEKLYQSFTGAW